MMSIHPYLLLLLYCLPDNNAINRVHLYKFDQLNISYTIRDHHDLPIVSPMQIANMIENAINGRG